MSLWFSADGRVCFTYVPNLIKLCFACSELFQNEILANFEMVPSAIHSYDHTIDSQEIVQQNVNSRRHDTLQNGEINQNYLAIPIHSSSKLTIFTEHVAMP